MVLPGLDFQRDGEPAQAVNLQRFSAAADAESLSAGPGDVGLALLPTCALYDVTSRTSGWCQLMGKDKHICQTALVMSKRVMGFLIACDQEFSYRQ